MANAKTIIEKAAQKSDAYLESEVGQKEIGRLHARECCFPSVEAGSANCRSWPSDKRSDQPSDRR